MSIFFREVRQVSASSGEPYGEQVPRYEVIVPVVAVACIVGLFLLSAAFKSFHRYQARADANNRVKVTAINIRNAQQQARVVTAQNATVNARAQQRYLEAVGIRRAQDEISKTLTPLYVQHEAIQAQERIATSGKNNTAIYIPAGNSGVPLVRDTSGDQASNQSVP